jgi:hypothetical protein
MRDKSAMIDPNSEYPIWTPYDSFEAAKTLLDKLMNEPDFIRAHKHSSHHREVILASESCGCFYCLKIFPPSDIQWWIDDDTTALCPNCDIDSVIGSKSGYPITVEFLEKMHQYWFAVKSPAELIAKSSKGK